MKTAFALLLSCAALCLAQTAAKLPQDAETESVKRLVSVTWDLAAHKLIWMVEKGTLVDGGFVRSSGVKYEVSPDDAMMMFGDEKRPFGAEEASNLHLLLNVLSRYCVDSVVWWEQGPGGPTSPQQSPEPGPVTKPEQPVQPKQPVAPAGKPMKVAQQKPRQP